MELSSHLQRMKERYGDRWFTYQPPEAEPVVVIENIDLGEAVPPKEYKTEHCKIEIPARKVLVIESYSMTLWSSAINPLWGGLYPVQLPETYLQGRMKWKPTLQRASPYINSSLLAGLTYSHGAPTYVPEKHDGFSLLKEFVGPRILGMPGDIFSIQKGNWDIDAGYPLDSEFNAWLLGEVRGYFLIIPDVTEAPPKPSGETPLDKPSRLPMDLVWKNNS